MTNEDQEQQPVRWEFALVVAAFDRSSIYGTFCCYLHH
jgi:hypothetical protein